MAQDYVQQIAAGDSSWFIICGTPGCGKTTLCTTIFRAIVEAANPAYMFRGGSICTDNN